MFTTLKVLTQAKHEANIRMVAQSQQILCPGPGVASDGKHPSQAHTCSLCFDEPLSLKIIIRPFTKSNLKQISL